MGADYYADVLLGVRIPKEKVYTRERVKAFEHDYPSDWKVCPKTGKALWREEGVSKLGALKTRGEIDVISPNEYGDNDYAYVTRHPITSVHVGFDAGRALLSEYRALSIGAFIEEDVAWFAANLPDELWDEDEFGIWLVSYVSC